MADESNDRRMFRFKDWVQIISVLVGVTMVAAGIFWQGGQLVQELRTISVTVAKIDARQEAFQAQQNRVDSDVRVLTERLNSIEGRINRLEAAR